MSVKDAVRFLEGLKEQTAPEETDLSSLLNRAKAEGYEVAHKDLDAAAAQILAKLQPSGELDDEQLESVAGGSSFANASRQAARYVNLLTSVMKQMNETEMGGERNLR